MMDEDTNCESLVLNEQLDDEFVDNQLKLNELEQNKLERTKLEKTELERTKSTDDHAANKSINDQTNQLEETKDLEDLNEKSKELDNHNINQDNEDNSEDNKVNENNEDNDKNEDNEDNEDKNEDNEDKNEDNEDNSIKDYNENHNKDNQNDLTKKSKQSNKHDHSNEHSVLVVHLLNGGKFECDVTSKSTGKDVFQKTCDYLILREYEYFGLTYRDAENVRIWINLDKKILKQIKDNPNSLHFEVKFFPEPTDLKENITRFFLSLQIRNNIVQEKIACSDETYAILGSFLVQSEFGNFDPAKHQDDYLNDFKFAPKPTVELINRLKELHKERKGLTAPEAELQFLQNAKKLSIYGLDFYPAKDANNESIKIGVCSSGLSVYKLSVCLESYPWLKINKISYNVDTFFIKIKPNENEDKTENNAENTVNFKMCSAKQAYDLWKITVEHHTFFKSLSNKNNNSLSSLSTSNKKSSRKNSKDQPIKSSKSSKSKHHHHHHHHRHKTSSKNDKDLKASSKKDRSSRKENSKASSSRKHKLDKLKSSNKLDKSDRIDKQDKLDTSNKHNSSKEYANDHHNEQSYREERYRSDRDRNDLNKDDYLGREIYSNKNHSKDKYPYSDVRDRTRQSSPSRHKRRREDDRDYYGKEERSYRDGDGRDYYRSKATYQESRDNSLSNENKRRRDYDRETSNQERENRNRSDRDYRAERSERTTLNRSPNKSSRSNRDKSEGADKSRRHKHKSKHSKNETKLNEKIRNAPISIAESHYQSLAEKEKSIKYHLDDKVSKSKDDKKHKHKKSKKSNENKSPSAKDSQLAQQQQQQNNKDDKKASNHFIKDIIDLDNNEEKSLNDNHQIMDMDTSENEAPKLNSKETVNSQSKQPKKDAKLSSKSNVEFDIFWDNEDNQSSAKQQQQQQDQNNKSKEDGKQDKSFIPRVLLNGSEVNRSTFKFELKSIRTGPKTPPDDFNIFESSTLSNQSIPTPTQDESQVCLKSSDKFTNNSSHVDSLNANSVRSLSPAHSMQSDKSPLNDNLVGGVGGNVANNQSSSTLNNHNAKTTSSSKFEIYDPERPLDSPDNSHANQVNNFNSVSKKSSSFNLKGNYNMFISNSSSANGDTFTDRQLDIDSPFSPSKTITSLSKQTQQQPKPSTSNNNSNNTTNNNTTNNNNNNNSLNNNNQTQNQFDLKLVLDHLIKAAQMQQKKNGGQPQTNDGQLKKQSNLGYQNDNDNLDYDDMPSSAVELNLREKYIKKLNRQERVVDEVKCHLKPYYQRKEVTKEEYKNIMRKAVPKICHSKTGEINPHKIQQLVESYIKKEKQARKK